MADLDSTLLGIAGSVVATLAGAVAVLWRQNSGLRKECETEKTALRTAYQLTIDDLRKAHIDEMRSRIGDAKDYNAASMKLQEVVIVTVNESKASDAKVASEIAENTRATRELTAKLMGKRGTDRE